MATPALGPSFGVAPSGTWICSRGCRGSWPGCPELRATAHHGARRLDRLLHHIAEGTGLHVAPLAGHRGGLDGQQFAAHGGPGEARHLSDLVFFLGNTEVELANAEQVRQHVRCHGGASLLFAQGDRLDHLAADLGDFTFEGPHARLARVVANDVDERILAESIPPSSDRCA
jgi:hypothetical protein